MDADEMVDGLVQGALRALGRFGSFGREQVDHIVKKAPSPRRPGTASRRGRPSRNCVPGAASRPSAKGGDAKARPG
ncbi:hypothetical protein ABZ667_23315 [Streptomyces lavendulae]|uniref:hypothetical protein n=1 Tax=Streptomyces lavendulae TaxID=1914 RepID=UPI0033CA3C48